MATARQQAHDETGRRLEPCCSTERQAFLDGLLTPEPTTGRTSHSGLRPAAVSPAAAQIIAPLKKIGFLQEAGVAQWDLASLNPNRAKWPSENDAIISGKVALQRLIFQQLSCFKM